MNSNPSGSVSVIVTEVSVLTPDSKVESIVKFTVSPAVIWVTSENLCGFELGLW